jgi:hypothetical protein
MKRVKGKDEKTYILESLAMVGFFNTQRISSAHTKYISLLCTAPNPSPSRPHHLPCPPTFGIPKKPEKKKKKQRRQTDNKKQWSGKTGE